MSPLEVETLLLTAQVALLSVVVVVPFGIVIAMLIEKLSPVKQAIALSVLSMPMALPPVLTGYTLLIVLGRDAPLGHFLNTHFGLHLSFSFAGAVLASSVVSFPFALRTLSVAMKSVDRTLLDAAATLGISRFRTFCWITAPLSWPGILGAAFLAFVRAFGEFGATAVFAGGFAGESRTLSIALWNLMQMPDQEQSLWRLLAVSVTFCFVALVASELLFLRMKRLAG